MAALLAYIGAGIILAWGVGHLIPTRSVVSGFGEVTADNSRIITMEWLAEGLTLCFIGVLSAVATWELGAGSSGAVIVLRLCAGMLLVLAAVSAFTVRWSPAIRPIPPPPASSGKTAACWIQKASCSVENL